VAVTKILKKSLGILTDKKKRKKAKTLAKGTKAFLRSPAAVGAALGGLVFVTDQLFKSSVELQPEEAFPHEITESGIGAQVEFDRLHNTGIAMGRLSENPKTAETLSLCGMGAVGVSLLTRDPSDKIGIVSDMVVLGGAASNLYDRKKRGYVVDYLHMKKGPLSKIVFNLGDAAIAAGAIIGTLSRKKRSGAYWEGG